MRKTKIKMDGLCQERYCKGRDEQLREGDQVMWLSNSPEESNGKKNLLS